MPDEFAEHLTRDQRPFLHTESLQILQIPSSMLILSPLQFSIGFRSEDWDGHGRTFVLCLVTHFCVDFGSLFCWKIQPWPYYKAFWPQDSTIFCNSPAVILWESLATQTIFLTSQTNKQTNTQHTTLLYTHTHTHRWTTVAVTLW